MASLRSCAAAVAALRAEPSEEAEQVTQAVQGEPLWAAEEEHGWVRVRTVYGYPGWVRAAALEGDPLNEARRLLGVPYEWGGTADSGLDCSGLVHVAFRRAGWIVPRDAHEQEAVGREVPDESLHPGDLVSFGSGARADHVAFWVGAGRILHATGREGVGRVVEEAEPAELRARRRRTFRLKGFAYEGAIPGTG